ncbi:ATP-binding protein [Neolewinella lacunae]|uniref:ATP-binding protein n=1 Tax=Neolewinella lacunae TaxID=1517758 RepID=A0A923T8M1_9BACT|nr:ATP-binding protein [Neolewinella lacunae]MBC6994719.1 ATP-binding protein [Neolewinella lacunae]MDN3634591.1 ATP-binding protein [Neolewinella lacunae]
MKFFGRENDLAELRKIREASKTQSRMTVVTGRRRIGKTRLILESLAGEEYLYFFVTRQDEQLLCAQFVEQLSRVLGIDVYQPYTEFRNVFRFLMELAHTRHINLVIDEFQEFTRINPAIYGFVQQYWDLNKDKAKINLILSGSVQTQMVRIFDSYQEPLYGRASAKFFIGPLSVATLHEIMHAYAPNYTAFDFLTLYAITGGVPYYVEVLADDQALSYDLILKHLLKHQSIFLPEGNFLLVQEFGKDYGTYFSVLALIANGQTTRGKIESVLQRPVGGYLTKLKDEYQIIDRLRPVFSKEGTTNVRYFIDDNFLRFWFRFIHKYDGPIETRNFAYVRQIIDRDFKTFAGPILEKLIRQKLAESHQFSHIGNYWERGNQNEIDVIAYNELTKKAVIGEVKMDPRNVSIDVLRLKAQEIIRKLSGYEVKYQSFSLQDVLKEPIAGQKNGQNPEQ